MSESGVFFYVTGALVALYIVVAGWRSRDAAYRPGEERRGSMLRVRTLDRRVVHWWRARRRNRSRPMTG